MADLVERLLAAIAKREQKATAALSQVWVDSAEERQPGDGVWVFEDSSYEGPLVRVEQTSENVAACLLDDYEHTRMAPEHAEHIAANDPASVLRLCQAHREIVELYRTECHMLDMGRTEWARGRALALRDVVRALAGGYGIQEENSDG